MEPEGIGLVVPTLALRLRASPDTLMCDLARPPRTVLARFRADVTKTTRQTLLETAVARLGREELAKAMNTPVHLIDAWLNGFATMPDRKLLDLANIIETLGDEPSDPG